MAKNSSTEPWYSFKEFALILTIFIIPALFFIIICVNDGFAQTNSNNTLTQPDRGLQPSQSISSRPHTRQPLLPSAESPKQPSTSEQITIDDINPNSPQVGDVISVSGTAYNCCYVTLNWGDGHRDSISHFDSGKWTAAHTYSLADTYRISATLSGEFSVTARRSITVVQPPPQLRATTLTLDKINDVNPGGSITLTGSLKDSNNVAIDGQTITFDGTGIADPQIIATTNDAGSFSVNTAAPSNPGTNLEVQAHFAGNSNLGYEKSDSNTIQYPITSPNPGNPTSEPNPGNVSSNQNGTSITLPDMLFVQVPEPAYKNVPQLPLWAAIVVVIAASIIAISTLKHLRKTKSSHPSNIIVEIKTEGGLE